MSGAGYTRPFVPVHACRQRWCIIAARTLRRSRHQLSVDAQRYVCQDSCETHFWLLVEHGKQPPEYFAISHACVSSGPPPAPIDGERRPGDVGKEGKGGARVTVCLRVRV